MWDSANLGLQGINTLIIMLRQLPTDGPQLPPLDVKSVNYCNNYRPAGEIYTR